MSTHDTEFTSFVKACPYCEHNTDSAKNSMFNKKEGIKFSVNETLEQKNNNNGEIQ